MPAPTIRELAARLGLHRSGREWRGDCPLCEYSDTLVLGTGRGGTPLLWCANCDDRDGLLALLRGDDVAAPSDYPRPRSPHQRQLRSDARGHLSGTPDAASRQEHQTEQKERALALWRGSRPAPGTLADRYLTRRGLPGLVASPALRFRPDCPHPQGGRLPAMVALVTDAAGQPLGIARTFLAPDGSAKADIEPPRATLGPIWGGAVRLDPAASELVIGEGIETASAAGWLLDRPAWAAVSAGNLGRALVLPPEVRSIVIAVDRDPAGERAARAAWRRWRAEGRTVQLLWPEAAGADCNDVLVALATAP